VLELFQPQSGGSGRDSTVGIFAMMYKQVHALPHARSHRIATESATKSWDCGEHYIWTRRRGLLLSASCRLQNLLLDSAEGLKRAPASQVQATSAAWEIPDMPFRRDAPSSGRRASVRWPAGDPRPDRISQSGRESDSRQPPAQHGPANLAAGQDRTLGPQRKTPYGSAGNRRGDKIVE